MTRKEHNGWTNYETWLIKLWIDNDEGLSIHWAEQAAGQLRRGPGSVSTLADQIKDYHEKALPELTGFAADLMDCALSEVDWHEIANSLIESAKERVKA